MRICVDIVRPARTVEHFSKRLSPLTNAVLHSVPDLRWHKASRPKTLDGQAITVHYAYDVVDRVRDKQDVAQYPAASGTGWTT